MIEKTYSTESGPLTLRLSPFKSRRMQNPVIADKVNKDYWQGSIDSPSFVVRQFGAMDKTDLALAASASLKRCGIDESANDIAELMQ